MKKLLFILMAITMVNCTKDDATTTQEETQEATLVGRWNVEGFETTVLYEFTADKRFTMYASEGEFESLEVVIASGRPGNDWWIEDDGKVTIDLNFGNYTTRTAEFVCDNNVVNWLNDDGDIVTTIFREGFDFSTCN